MAGTRPRRVGMITPSSNTAIEPITQAVCTPLADRVTTHFNRLRVIKNSIASDAQQQFDPSAMVVSATLLADAHMDAIVWNGTAGGWMGLETDRIACEAITEATGTPAGTAFSAQVEAMRRMGVERYAMVSPYEPAMNEAIAKTLESEGFECVHAHGLAITDNVKLGDLTREELRDHVVAESRPADAILVPCTNYAVGWVVDELEAELGIPIIDSVLLAIWEGFRLAGVPTPVEGWGVFMTGRWD